MEQFQSDPRLVSTDFVQKLKSSAGAPAAGAAGAGKLKQATLESMFSRPAAALAEGPLAAALAKEAGFESVAAFNAAGGADKKPVRRLFSLPIERIGGTLVSAGNEPRNCDVTNEPICLWKRIPRMDGCAVLTVFRQAAKRKPEDEGKNKDSAIDVDQPAPSSQGKKDEAKKDKEAGEEKEAKEKPPKKKKQKDGEDGSAKSDKPKKEKKDKETKKKEKEAKQKEKESKKKAREDKKKAKEDKKKDKEEKKKKKEKKKDPNAPKGPTNPFIYFANVRRIAVTTFCFSLPLRERSSLSSLLPFTGFSPLSSQSSPARPPQEQREQMTKDGKQLSPAERGQILSEKWKALTEEQKKPFLVRPPASPSASPCSFAPPV